MPRTSLKRSHSQIEPSNASGTVSKHVSPEEEALAPLNTPTHRIPIDESFHQLQLAMQSLPTSVDKIELLNGLFSWKARYNLPETNFNYPSKFKTAYLFSKCANILPDDSPVIGYIAAILDQLCDMPPQTFTNFRNFIRLNPGRIERHIYDFGLRT